MELITILISGFLFRVPRGGPSGDWWHQKIGVGPGSFGGALIWAVTLGICSFLWGAPVWLAFLLVVWMMLAESAGWMKWVADDRVDVLPLCVRGLPLFNPLFGVWYWVFWKLQLRRFGVVLEKEAKLLHPLLDGFTAYAELFNGLTTSLAVYALVKVFF